MLALDTHLACAWPAIDRKRIGDFELRFGGGYGRRSNSARLLRSSRMGRSNGIDAQTLDRIEAAYREAGLRPTFYVAPALSDDGLRATLAARGYQASEEFGVFVGAVGTILANTRRSDAVSSIAATDPRTMARTLTTIEAGKSGEEERLAELFAHAIPGTWLASMRDPASVDHAPIVAAAIGVLEGELFSIHELVTARSERRRGHAHDLLLALVEAARAGGARTACAQIAATNPASEALFECLSFRRLYSYRYMSAPTEPDKRRESERAC